MSIEDQLTRIADAVEILLERFKMPTEEVAANGAAALVDEPTVVHYQQVRDGFIKLAETKGNTVAMKLLEKFKVKNGKELKPEQYADFVKAIEAEMTPLV